MRKFRLLKDTPQGKMGTVIQQKEEGKPYWPIIKEGNWNRVAEIENIFAANLVENNPEWFEEIKEDMPIRLFGAPGKKGLDTISKYEHDGKVYCHKELYEKELKLMEAALNGDLFTEGEVIQAIIFYTYGFYPTHVHTDAYLFKVRNILNKINVKRK